VTPEPRGRLELTWTNKHLRLLSHGANTYEWCDPEDFRVAEVRLLHEVEVVGEPSDNLLIQGDAMHALDALLRIPEYQSKYAGKFRLCYIDPPFNTGQTFAQYDDALEHSVWLTLLRDRLQQIHKLLQADGTVWLHLDDVEVHRARAVLDEVFGPANFLGTVIWEKTDSPRMDASTFSVRHDTLLVYQKSPGAKLRGLPTSKTHANRTTEDGRRYYLNPLRARGGQGSTREARPTLYFGITAPDGTEVFPRLPSGGDGAWRWSKDKVERDVAEIEWVKGKGGWNPYYRIYEKENPTRPPETLWRHEEVGSTRTSAAEVKALFDGRAFATPKPEALLERVISIASDPGDLVLDCFAGSGTTAAVAHKMGRRWVTVEASADTTTEFVAPRLAKVVQGDDPGGISTIQTEIFEGDLPDKIDAAEVRKAAGLLKPLLEHGVFEEIEGVDGDLIAAVAAAMRRAAKVQNVPLVRWSGGGGFRVLAVGPSMFEDFGGHVVLAESVTSGDLARGVAAQLGYTFEPEGPFAGRRGRSRLAVIDGVLTPEIARFIVGELSEHEQTLIVAQAVEPGCEDLVRELRRGSRVRKVPRDIARVGHRTEVVTMQAAGAEDGRIEPPSESEETGE
jgi:adenine-specific DNA-methyltransferase